MNETYELKIFSNDAEVRYYNIIMLHFKSLNFTTKNFKQLLQDLTLCMSRYFGKAMSCFVMLLLQMKHLLLRKPSNSWVLDIIQNFISFNLKNISQRK